MRNIYTIIITALLFLLIANVASAQSVMPTIKIYGDFNDIYAKGKIIVNDPDSLKSDTFDMYAKHRGATARTFQKKSYSIKLVDSSDSKLLVSLLGLRNDNNWILDAMAVDKARMRNRVAFDIWNAMDVKPYYYEKEPKARTGISGRFVELYLNDEYNGIYCLNEKIDRKQLKIKKTKDGEIRGVLYKGTSPYGAYFRDPPEEYYNDNSCYQGFEAVYPDVNEDGYTEWGPLVEKEELISNLDEDVFAVEYEDHFDVPVLMNLNILINAVGSMDNSGKNQYFYFYDITSNNKLSFAPWDMDASFARSWDGTMFEGIDEVLLYENRLIQAIKRVDSTFMEKTHKRYSELRRTILSKESLKNRFDTYWNLFEKSGALRREYDRWNGSDGIDLDFDEEKIIINKFIDSHLSFLDNYFEYNAGYKNVPNVMLDAGVTYDLFGRRVYELQPGHVYIKDGKCIYIEK